MRHAHSVPSPGTWDRRHSAACSIRCCLASRISPPRSIDALVVSGRISSLFVFCFVFAAGSSTRQIQDYPRFGFIRSVLGWGEGLGFKDRASFHVLILTLESIHSLSGLTFGTVGQGLRVSKKPYNVCVCGGGVLYEALVLV